MNSAAIMAAAVLAFGLAACNPAGGHAVPGAGALTESDLAGFGTLYDGVFETPASETGAIIRDRRERLHSSAFPGYWYYMQMNTGPEKKLYRQRVLQFELSSDGSAVVQTTYDLNNAADFADLWDKADAMLGLSQDDISRFFSSDCEQRWTLSADVWSGYVDPETCKIFSERRGANILIESESRLSSDMYQTTERGFDEAGEFLWGSKPGEFNTLYRVEGE